MILKLCLPFVRIRAHYYPNWFLGDWSDSDPKWSQVAESVKRSMGQNRLDDGEFWMEFFSDFCREFEEVSICTLGPDFNHDGIVDKSQVAKLR